MNNRLSAHLPSIAAAERCEEHACAEVRRDVERTVIPANAGIQSSTSCEAHKILISCAARAMYDWIPAFAHCCPRKTFAVFAGKLKQRHSSGSWNPATQRASKALDPSFRWDDESVALNLLAKWLASDNRQYMFRAELIFPGQQWAFAGMTGWDSTATEKISSSAHGGEHAA